MSTLLPTSFADLGWPTLVDHWARRCATLRGAAAVRGVVPFDAIGDATLRTREISQARTLATRGAALPLGSIFDIAQAIERVRLAAALDAPDLVAAARTAEALARLRKHLREHAPHAPELGVYAPRLPDLGHVYHPILDAFDAVGRLVDHASDELGPLRRAVLSIKQQLEKRMKTLLEDERFAPYLQDGFYTQRDERYVLPIRTDGKGFVRGILHGTSQSGQTLFIEPEEIVELNNRLKLAECDVADEERRIMVRFSGWIAEEASAFAEGLAAAETLDVIAAGGLLAEELVAAEPIIEAAPRVALRHARHPLMLLAGRRCVANDVLVDAGGSLVVSGPNAGGKTVALKTAGLAALMVRCGLHLAAESGSVMGWFTDIRTDIGDAQSLEHNLSTFSGHLLNLGRILDVAAPGVLVLVDEIAVGTDPDQGAALAQAVLETLSARGATTLVTTHYERLKALGAGTLHFRNASVGFDLQQMEPTFKLHLGSPGSSGALAVARRLGLHEPLVARAEVLLGEAGVRIEDLLASVADQRRRMEEERAALLAELEAVEAERGLMLANRERTQRKLEQELRLEHGETLTALRQARREIDEVRRIMKAKQANDSLIAEDPKIANRRLVGPGAAVARAEPKPPQLPGSPITPAQIVVGAPVIVPGLGRAQIASAPRDGKVDVQVGSMRSSVAIGQLLFDTHRAAARAEKAVAASVPIPEGTGRTGRNVRGKQAPEIAGAVAGGLVFGDGARDGRANARTPDSTVDIRGHRAEEARAIVDQFLDESLLANRDSIFVIHGHGTGALRTAIRGHLKGHRGVDRFRPGEPSEGGDGITVAWLK